MHSSFRQITHARSTDPVTLVLIGLSILFTIIFIFGFRHADQAATIVPAIAIALCVSLLLVPQRNLSNILLIAIGLSIPFAHFAVVVVVGEGIQWMHIFGVLLIIHLFARFLLGQRLSIAPATPWVLGFVVASFISTLTVINEPGEHIEEFWKSEVQLFFIVLLFLAVTQIRMKDSRMLLLLKLMIVLSVLIALFGIYQLPARFFGLPGAVLKLTNPSLSGSTQVIRVIQYMVRSSSIFSEPGYYGHYLVGMMALSLTAAMHRPKLFGSPSLLYGMIGIQIIGLVFSSSMGSFYIFTELILVMILLERRIQRNRILITILAIIIIGGITMSVAESISGFPLREYLSERVYGIYMFVITGGDRSFMVGSESAYQRVDTAQIAMRVWQDHPLIGVGMGSYSLISYRYGDYNPSGFAANALVNILAETGIIGLIAILGVAFSSLMGLFRIFYRKPEHSTTDSTNTNDEILPLIARMVFYLIAVEMIYFHVISSFYWPGIWFYLGLGGMIVLAARRKETSRTISN